MIVHQVELGDADQHRMVVWVDAALGLKAGHHVIGKNAQAWRVLTVYRQTLDVADINRDWRVGGLL